MPEIISHKQITKSYFKLSLKAPQIAKAAKPGQFVMVKISDTGGVLLRRPLGIHRVKGQGLRVKEIEILYEVVGKGTEILSRKRLGEDLDVIGPLGNGFDYSPRSTVHGPRVLVAGGMGVAPLLFLAEKLMEHKVLVLIGAGDKESILCENDFKKLGCEVGIATDNGSRGHKGKVTDLLKKRLWTMDHGLSTIYACGPQPMLKEISRLAREYKVPALVSLEAHMACGIGACLGCVVNTKTGYKRVCKEGPVFNAAEIIWEGE